MVRIEKRKYIEKYFRKCLQIEGVQNGIVFNNLGIPKHSTFTRDETIRSIGLFDDLILKVKRAIQLININDQFISIRLRTHKFEIVFSKDIDDIHFVIFQNARGDKLNRYFHQIVISMFNLKIVFSSRKINRYTQPVTSC